MKILSIETSCDETAASILDAEGTVENPQFTLLGNALHSQAKIHAKYGGVYPNLAKREHAKNLPPLLKVALTEAGLLKKLKTDTSLPAETENNIREILAREDVIFTEASPRLEILTRPP